MEARMNRNAISLRQAKTTSTILGGLCPTLVLALTGVLATATMCFAQSDTATLSGTVTDPDRAVVPGAAITIKNLQTGAERAVKSDDSGVFSAPGLNPSTYSMRVERLGFQSAVIPNFVLNVGDRKQVNITLKIGGVTESVTVAAESALVTTETSVSNVVDRKYIENMPLNGRSFQDLMLLSPGTVTNSPQNTADANSGTISVNGQGAASNSFSVDGVSANVGAGNKGGYSNIGNAGALPNGTSVGTTQSLVSVDALQEFRVETSS
jgi:hypothetical protein